MPYSRNAHPFPACPFTPSPRQRWVSFSEEIFMLVKRTMDYTLCSLSQKWLDLGQSHFWSWKFAVVTHYFYEFLIAWTGSQIKLCQSLYGINTEKQRSRFVAKDRKEWHRQADKRRSEWPWDTGETQKANFIPNFWVPGFWCLMRPSYKMRFCSFHPEP